MKKTPEQKIEEKIQKHRADIAKKRPRYASSPFGPLIYEFRIRHLRIDQTTLAGALGISQSMLSKVESNELEPTLDVFLRTNYLACQHSDEAFDLFQNVLGQINASLGGEKALSCLLRGTKPRGNPTGPLPRGEKNSHPLSKRLAG